MLLKLKSFSKIYIYRPFTDFRKGIHGLSSIVQEEMELNLFEKYLFIFCNSNRNGIKVLYWDDNGFALWYKRLEKEKFKWPSHLKKESVSIDVKKLEEFLNGLNPWQVPFEKLNYKKV